MGGSSAPKPDPNIGVAAVKSAQTGEDMLNWMKDQAEITNGWAKEDRDRQQSVFIPLQDKFIAEANAWDSAGRKNARATAAVADTRLQARLAAGSRMRSAMAMGVNPASGAFQSGSAKAALGEGLAAVGASTGAGRQVEAEAEAKRANAINLGSGLAVNPATSMGLSNGAIQAGGSAAMQGYGQQGSLLNADYQNRMGAWQAGQQQQAGIFGAMGTMAGMIPWGQVGTAAMAMLSDKDAKTDKKPLPEGAALGAIRKMPVERWRYKPGMGDGGEHVGTYAQDFAKATGHGDGKVIDITSAIGVTMGAIRDLDRKVDKLARAA